MKTSGVEEKKYTLDEKDKKTEETRSQIFDQMIFSHCRYLSVALARPMSARGPMLEDKGTDREDQRNKGTNCYAEQAVTPANGKVSVLVLIDAFSMGRLSASLINFEAVELYAELHCPRRGPFSASFAGRLLDVKTRLLVLASRRGGIFNRTVTHRCNPAPKYEKRRKNIWGCPPMIRISSRLFT